MSSIVLSCNTSALLYIHIDLLQTQILFYLDLLILNSMIWNLNRNSMASFQQAIRLLYPLVFLECVLMFLISLLFLHALFKAVYQRNLCNEAFLSRLDLQLLKVHHMSNKPKELWFLVKLLLIWCEKAFLLLL